MGNEERKKQQERRRDGGNATTKLHPKNLSIARAGIPAPREPL
jgi:hypothetical protein